VASRLYNVRGLGLGNPEALARDAMRYQKAQELMKAQRMKDEKRDKSYQRIQGVDGSVVIPGVNAWVDKRQAKMKGNQAQLFIEFVGSQQKVGMSEEILIPQDGYAGTCVRACVCV